MKSFALTGAASVIIGAIVGGLMVLGATSAVQQTKRPAIDRSANQNSSLLNNVQYGSR